MELYGITCLGLAFAGLLVGIFFAIHGEEDAFFVIAISVAFILGGLITGSATYTNAEKRAIEAGVAKYEGSINPKTGRVNKKFVWITNENNKKEEIK